MSAPDDSEPVLVALLVAPCGRGNGHEGGLLEAVSDRLRATGARRLRLADGISLVSERPPTRHRSQPHTGLPSAPSHAKENRKRTPTDTTNPARRPTVSPSALLAIALAAEVAILAATIREAFDAGEPGVRIFWFVLSLLLLYRVRRGGRLSWAFLVGLGIMGAGSMLVSIGRFHGLGLLLLAIVQLGVLLSPQVRAHVGATRA